MSVNNEYEGRRRKMRFWKLEIISYYYLILPKKQSGFILKQNSRVEGQ